MDVANHLVEVLWYQAVFIPLLDVSEQLCVGFGNLSLYLLSFLQQIVGIRHDAGEALDESIHVMCCPCC